MRLVHRRDQEGRLVESIDGGVVREPVEGDVVVRTRPEATTGCGVEPDPELHMREDDPRASSRPAALVVDEDPGMRIMLRDVLEAQGYVVATCPGPRATHCEAARKGAGGTVPCGRILPRTRLVLIDEVAAETHLAEAYRVWLPGANVALRKSVASI
jgi:hypothetical protein